MPYARLPVPCLSFFKEEIVLLWISFWFVCRCTDGSDYAYVAFMNADFSSDSD